jgi:YggT family protein
MTQTLILIIDLVMRLATLLFLVRFLLQASGADFYNPISQAVIKGSDPLAAPLRKLLPATGKFDLATLLLAFVMGVVFVALISMGRLTISQYAIFGIVRTLSVLVDFYWWSMLIIVIASFVSQGNSHPGLSLLDQLVDPLIRPIRSILPSMGPLDFSPMVVILMLSIAQRSLPNAYAFI